LIRLTSLLKISLKFRHEGRRQPRGKDEKATRGKDDNQGKGRQPGERTATRGKEDNQGKGREGNRGKDEKASRCPQSALQVLAQCTSAAKFPHFLLSCYMYFKIKKQNPKARGFRQRNKLPLGEQHNILNFQSTKMASLHMNMRSAPVARVRGRSYPSTIVVGRWREWLMGGSQQQQQQQSTPPMIMGGHESKGISNV